jgi:lipopolysaccharide biosynthesis glycosyltransferase
MQSQRQNQAIVFGIDRNYTMPLTTSIRSLLENSSSFKDIFVLHSGSLTESEKEPVVSSLRDLSGFRLTWLPVENQLISDLSPGLPHVSRATYLRFLAADVLPNSFETALYLDSDTVVRTDLSHIFSLYDPRWAAQACLDITGIFRSPFTQVPDPSQWGIGDEDRYFNSGVLLMNLKIWREEKLAAKLLNFAALNPECLFIADQNVMNIVLHGRIGLLPPEWNAQFVHPNFRDGTWNQRVLTQPSMEEAKIYHYVTEFKPWNKGMDWPEAKVFLDIFGRTQWANRL